MFYQQRKNYKNGRGFYIEPEEIFLDVAVHNDPANPKAYLEKRLEALISQRAFVIIVFLFLLCGLLVLARAGQLQLKEQQHWAQLAEKNRSRIYPVAAQRGIIYDRNFKPLVKNQPRSDVVVIPELLPSLEEKLGKISEAVAGIFVSEHDEILSRFGSLDLRSAEPVPIAYNISQEQLVKLEALLPDLPGVRIERNFQRRYLSGPIDAHLLGYTGLVSAEDIAASSKKFFRTDVIGKSGLELAYDQDLRGVNGQRRFDIDSRGGIRGEELINNPVAGENIVVTIDSELQTLLYQEIASIIERLGTKRGGVAVAIDPRNGEILSLVSWPGFDNNLFAQGISSVNYQGLLSDPFQPLFNRAISGQYPPGSSFKPVVAVGALQEGVITPEREIFDKGYIALANPFHAGQVTIFPDWKAHGWVNMEKALAYSANVYFYMIGGGYQDINGLGVSRIKKYAELFGLGSTTGIDLPAEAAGLLPDEKWKSIKKPQDPIWRLGDTYHVSIGQGDVLVTPLQLASAVSAIANGGTLYRPHLLKKVLDQDLEVLAEQQPEMVRQNFIDPQIIDEVKRGMKGVNTYGTAPLMASLPVDSGGKTGTAQFGVGNEQTHGWYSVFAPYEKPEIALVVLVEGGGEGSVVAMPIAHRVLSWYFTRHQNPVVSYATTTLPTR